MNESYPLARAGAELEELVIEACRRGTEVALTDESGSITVIVPIPQYRELQAALDRADLAEAEAIRNSGEWLPHEEVLRLLELDAAEDAAAK